MATKNLLIEAVKHGGDRRQLHEIIRKCSMEATEKMKKGEARDFLACLSKEPAFGLPQNDMSDLFAPAKYIGRCAEQVDALTEKSDRLSPT